jgi:DNA-binding Xre family transcriptional regulator
MLSSVTSMPIKFSLRTIIARKNLARAEAGMPPLTQTEIAASSGVSQSVVSKFLTKPPKRIDLETIDRLCSFLDITPNDLLGYTPDTDQ